MKNLILSLIIYLQNEEEIKDLTQEEENNLVSDKQIIKSNRCCTCAIF